MKTPTKKQIEEDFKIVQNLEKLIDEQLHSQLEEETKISYVSGKVRID